MRIGLNGQNILIENPAGPEKFTINLYKALSKVDKENSYTIYLTKRPSKEFWNYISSGNRNFRYKVIWPNFLWTQVFLALELFIHPVDIFFTAIHTIPILRRRKTKFVLMVHGLEYKYSKDFNNQIKKIKIERPVKYAVKHSDLIITPSKATRSEIVNRNWTKDRSKIEIVNEGITDIFYKEDQRGVEIIRQKYGIGNDPYLFFISTIQPRKNIPNMIEAFSLFIKENENYKNMKLLIAGKKGWDFENSLVAPEKYGVKENVKFLGRVPDEDVPLLFQGSCGHINVSFEEGFGLPLAESLASGVLSVVSDIPAYKEVGGELPIFVNPNDVNNIRNGIKKLLTSQITDFDKSLLIKRSKLFSWENTAQETLRLFKKFSLTKE